MKDNLGEEVGRVISMKMLGDVGSLDHTSMGRDLWRIREGALLFLIGAREVEAGAAGRTGGDVLDEMDNLLLDAKVHGSNKLDCNLGSQPIVNFDIDLAWYSGIRDRGALQAPAQSS